MRISTQSGGVHVVHSAIFMLVGAEEIIMKVERAKRNNCQTDLQKQSRTEQPVKNQRREANQYHHRPRQHSTRIISESAARRTTQLSLEANQNDHITSVATTTTPLSIKITFVTFRINQQRNSRRMKLQHTVYLRH